jgi:hypothetical protein
MRVPLQFALLLLLVLLPLARGQEAFRSESAAARQPLEIRLVRRPSWHDHYLEITIKRVNHSKSRIFLSRVEMYSSVTRAKSTVELGGQGEWILVYGWTDVIESEDEERTLAPEREEQNTYYIGEAFPIEDMVTNTTRQVRVRGRLRILASYAQRVPKREIKGRQQKVEKRRISAEEADSGSRISGQAALEVEIPCQPGASNSDCSSPPPIFPGEHNQWTILPKAPVL